MGDKERLEALAKLIAVELGKAPPKAKLRLVEAPPAKAPPLLDAVTRESHIKMIGHLRRRFGLQVLVDQAIFGKGSVDRLEDDDLVALHSALETACENAKMGIPLEDTDLLRSRRA